MLSNKTYDVLKFIALAILPGLATCVIAIFKIWGIPYGAEIGGTITAIATFLGGLLTYSNIKYKQKEETQNEAE